MKELSFRQAYNCENAKEPVCKCRCGGSLHGAKRGGEEPNREFFETLPDDDPHRMLTKTEKREASNARKREQTRIKNEKIMAAWLKLHSTPSK